MAALQNGVKPINIGPSTGVGKVVGVDINGAAAWRFKVGGTPSFKGSGLQFHVVPNGNAVTVKTSMLGGLQNAAEHISSPITEDIIFDQSMDFGSAEFASDGAGDGAARIMVKCPVNRDIDLDPID
ncbi:MAG: hypothetical protein ACR2PJ_05975 [Pseudomonadales bacterium]